MALNVSTSPASGPNKLDDQTDRELKDIQAGDDLGSNRRVNSSDRKSIVALAYETNENQGNIEDRNKLSGTGSRQVDRKLLDQTLGSLDAAAPSVEFDIMAFILEFQKLAQQIRSGNLKSRQSEMALIPQQIEQVARDAKAAANSTCMAEAISGGLSIAGGLIQIGTATASLKMARSALKEANTSTQDLASTRQDIKSAKADIAQREADLTTAKAAHNAVSPQVVQAQQKLNNAKSSLKTIRQKLAAQTKSADSLSRISELKTGYARAMSQAGDATSTIVQGFGRVSAGFSNQQAGIYNADSRRADSYKDLSLTNMQYMLDMANQARDAVNEAREAVARHQAEWYRNPGQHRPEHQGLKPHCAFARR